MSKYEERNLSKESCKLIDLHMKQKGITGPKLAKAVNVSYSYIYCITQGKRRCISFRILKKIAEALDIDVYQLTGEQRPGDTAQETTFEEMFFSNSISIEGREIDYEQKATMYDIFKAFVKPDLTVPKKLELIITKLYEQKGPSPVT